MKLQTWRLDAPGWTLALAGDGAMPWVVHWGPALPGTENIETLARSQFLDVTGGGMDRNAPLSICPEAALTFPGHPGLEARRDGQALFPRFMLTAADATDQDLTFTLTADDLTYRARFAKTDVGGGGAILKADAKLTSGRPLDLLWLAAPVLPAPQHADDIVDISGRWLGEFRPVTNPWSPGLRIREARLGRSGHEHPPFANLPERGATETQGTVFASHLAWSGGHRMIAEELRRTAAVNCNGASCPARRPRARISPPPQPFTPFRNGAKTDAPSPSSAICATITCTAPGACPAPFTTIAGKRSILTIPFLFSRT